MVESFFTRTPRIKTESAMLETLKSRTAGRSGASQKLIWNKPVRQENESGYQTAAGTDYVVRKTNPDGKVMYWAWHARKLLGYSHDVEIARAHCEAHALGSGT